MINVRCLHFVIVILTVTGWSSSIRADQKDDEAAVIESVKSYVAAFNRRDADAVSEHWSVTGEQIEPDGTVLAGRKAIRESFTQVFEGLSDDQLLTVSIDRISFVTADVALDEGIAHVIGGWQSSYVATHKFEDGKWRIHSIRETELPSPPSHYDRLKELEWMIGNWVDESDDSIVESSCHWSKNKNFISKHFKVSVPGMEPLEGTQIIGFDASTGNVCSWIFDSDGGFGKGIWSRKGNTWEVRSSQVLADGRTASATNIYRLIDDNQFSWKSIGRNVDGQFLPNTESVRVVRIQDEPAE